MNSADSASNAPASSPVVGGFRLRTKNERPTVEITGVNHAFGAGANRKQVLFDNTLRIWPGEIVIMTGPSGSGKTTLLTLIGALRSPQEGSVRVFDRELLGLDARGQEQVRRGIGFIFQAHNLFESLTASQTLRFAMQLHAYPAEELAGRPARLLEELGLGHRLDYKPANLSGGQRQRVAIGRALVNHPRLILADEPTAALDKETGRQVVTMLKRRALEEGCSIMIVTHDPRIIDVADRIVNMVDGQIVADLDVQEQLLICGFLRTCPVFAQTDGRLLADLAAKLKRERFEVGQTIIREGEGGDKFYLVREGAVEITKAGAARPLAVLAPGQFFGELALINDAPRAATGTAREPTEVFSLDKERFLDAIRTNADLERQIKKSSFGG